MDKVRFRKDFTIRDKRFSSSPYSWDLHGAQGTVSLNITYYKDQEKRYNYYGGVEYHSRNPDKHRPHDAPDHINCAVLGGAPCWHDGTSLGAESLVEYFKQSCTEGGGEVINIPDFVHEHVFLDLSSNYRAYFMEDDFGDVVGDFNE